MQYPNDIQAALLFNKRVDCLDKIVRDFTRIQEARTGTRFNLLEAKPGVFHRLYGGDEMMITLEYVDRSADMNMFQKALASAVTGIVCPDIRERLARNRSTILINVSHGVLGNGPQVLQLMQLLGQPMEGHSLPQFRRRLDVCALISRMVCDHVPASVVHWVQSNQLLPGEAFDAFAGEAAPSPLHIHPYLFGDGRRGEAKPKLGIRTFGMRHFIGREVLVQPSVLPWAANYETILAFLRVATMENGYVIPHGDTFGPEDRSLSYRVLHRDAEPDDVPLYELQPLMHREYGFVADDYVPTDRVFDDQVPPANLVAQDDGSLARLVEEWRAKRALAEGIGGRFEVRAAGAPAGGPERPGGGTVVRPVFGRKRSGS